MNRITTEPTIHCHVALSDTLRNIRRRAGYSTVDALAEYLEVHAKRIAEFEAGDWVDSELMTIYGHLARRRTP